MFASRYLRGGLQRMWRCGLKPVLQIAAVLSLVAPVSVYADDYSANWGPAVGSQLPLLAAKDQSGVDQTLRSLTGKQGLLLFMNRSADW